MSAWTHIAGTMCTVARPETVQGVLRENQPHGSECSSTCRHYDLLGRYDDQGREDPGGYYCWALTGDLRDVDDLSDAVRWLTHIVEKLGQELTRLEVEVDVESDSIYRFRAEAGQLTLVPRNYEHVPNQ